MISTDTKANVTPPGWAAHQRVWRHIAGEPSAAAVRLAAAYLVVSSVALVASGHDRLLMLHLAVLALLGWAAMSRAAGPTATSAASSPLTGAATLVFDFAPVLTVIALAYGEVPVLVSSFGVPYRDALVQHWEASLFGTQPSHAFAGAVPNLFLSELLHGGYLAYYLALSLPALVLYARGERRGFSETAMVLIVPWLIGCAWYVFFPVQGPRYVWTAPPGVSDGPFRHLSLVILGAGSARGTAFPSLHMAVSLSQAIIAWRWQPRWLAIVLSVVATLVGFGAVYAGYHYAIDMIAGALLGSITSFALLYSWSATPFSNE